MCSLVDGAAFVHPNTPIAPTTTCTQSFTRCGSRCGSTPGLKGGKLCEQVDPATAGPRAVISEGQRVPAGPWRPEAGGPWAASLPAGAPVLRHVRTLWVSGVKVSCDSWASVLPPSLYHYTSQSEKEECRRSARLIYRGFRVNSRRDARGGHPIIKLSSSV